ncbi:MAG: S8 family serine peptidase [Anaerolineae bacterium]|nr:S8 family serine peptidase [Anaerolineae bacterium]
MIVRYHPGAPPKLPKGTDFRLKRTFATIPALAARLPAEGVAALVNDEAVERVWLDFRVHALLDRSVGPVRADVAWEAGLTGEGVRVAILDTGIDPDHPDFGDRVLAAVSYPQTGGEPKPWSRRRRLSLSTTDANGHGTHVAGIAAGSGAASQGRFRGIAPEAGLLVAKVLADDGSGDASDVIAGLEWALENGAQVACLSLGGSQAGDGTDALSVMCDELAEQGLIICVAAGNAGPRPYTIGPPGCAREVITVGAADITHAHEGTAGVAPFSSRGPTTDRRAKPDILFPGVGIASCRSAAGTMGDPVPGFEEYYVRSSGSSMAAPFAAGASALILQARPEATPRQVKEMLCAGARDLGLDANAQGSGLGDIAHSLEVLPPEELLGPAPVPARSGCLLAGWPALVGRLSDLRLARAGS